MPFCGIHSRWSSDSKCTQCGMADGGSTYTLEQNWEDIWLLLVCQKNRRRCGCGSGCLSFLNALYLWETGWVIYHQEREHHLCFCLRWYRWMPDFTLPTRYNSHRSWIGIRVRCGWREVSFCSCSLVMLLIVGAMIMLSKWAAVTDSTCPNTSAPQTVALASTCRDNM